MKLNLKFTKSRNEKTPIRVIKPALPERFRLLKWDEVVGRGDYVGDADKGFKLWEGPTGFRADAFVDSIYRQTAGA